MVREATWTDVPALAGLWQECCDDEDKDLKVPRYPTPGDPTEFLRSLIEHPLGHILVTEEDGQLVGFIAAQINRRAVGHPTEFVKVEMMYTRPDYRKLVGNARTSRTMMKNWVESVSEAESVEITSRPSERQLMRWLRKRYFPYAVSMWRKI